MQSGYFKLLPLNISSMWDNAFVNELDLTAPQCTYTLKYDVQDKHIWSIFKQRNQQEMVGRVILSLSIQKSIKR